MKKKFLLCALTILLLVLTACGTKSSGTTSATGKAISLTPAYKLALETLDLEGTAEALDSKSAAQLLPLWQLLDELSASASAAPQEITAVVDSIRTSMTAEQLGAIDNMQLTEFDIALAAQGGRSAGTTSSASASSRTTSRASSGAGTILAGADGQPPDGGIAGGPGPSANSQANSSSSNSSTPSSTTSLIEQVIALLQAKIKG